MRTQTITVSTAKDARWTVVREFAHDTPNALFAVPLIDGTDFDTMGAADAVHAAIDLDLGHVRT